MSTITTVNDIPEVSALDINSLISLIKTYIKTKTLFTDYDFEGSNISMIVRILAYVAQYDSFNINMVANELKLSTALLRDNVVNISKQLGYTPSSAISSQVNININLIGVSAYNTIILSAGSVLTSTNGGTLYTFLNPSNLSFSNSTNSGSFQLPNITLYEGLQLTTSFVVDTSNEEQTFVLNNSGIDAESIKVFVFNTITATTPVEYTRTKTITNVSNSDTVFFVNEVDDVNYEILFGDNVIGRKLENGEVIQVQYRLCNGSAANNLRSFNFIGTLTGLNISGSTILTSSNISTIDINGGFSDGGSDLETIQSVKYRAPRYYAANERAVTLPDFEAITPTLYPNAELVKVYGGESINPPQYGTVFIAIKPYNGFFISTIEKENLKREFLNYTNGSIDVEFYDPTIYNINVKTKVIYDKTKTTKTPSQISSLVQANLVSYINTSDLYQFGGNFSTGAIECGVNSIDNAIQAVTIWNTVSVPITLSSQNISYNINFNTPLLYNVSQNFTLLSEYFVASCVPYKVYLFATTNDSRLDKNTVYLKDSNGDIIRSVGTINYKIGLATVTLKGIDSSSFKVYAIPDYKDFTIAAGSYPILTIDSIEVVDLLQRNLTTNITEPQLPYSIITSLSDTTGDTSITCDTLIPVIPNIGESNSNIGNDTNVINTNTGIDSTNDNNSNQTFVPNLNSLIPETITC